MLKHRAVRAVVWSGADTLLRQGLQFAATVVLARLLVPADFGLVAMLSLFTGIATVLMDGGLSAALIQKREIDRIDESTAFWCNAIAGVVLAAVIVIAAPAIARFYGAPILRPLARFMSLACVLSSLGTVHAALLTRGLDFRTQAKAGAVAALVSTCVGIALALHGMGPWALATQAVVMAGTFSASLWWLHPWRPLLGFSRASLRRLTGFGAFHLGSSLLEMFHARLYTLLVGRLFGTRELGLYANADYARQLPGNFLGGLISRVALAMFSAASDDVALLRRGMQLSLRGMMLINAPVMFGMAVLAEPVLAVLFGPQWTSAAPVLRVLCLAAVLYPLHVVNLHVLMAQGHARLMFRLEMLKKAAGVTLLLVGLRHGVLGVAWSYVAFSILALFVNAYWSGRLLGYGAFSQLREIGPPVLAAAAAALVVIGVRSEYALGATPPWIQLAVFGAGGAACYLLLITLARIHALADVIALFRIPERNAS